MVNSWRFQVNWPWNCIVKFQVVHGFQKFTTWCFITGFSLSVLFTMTLALSRQIDVVFRCAPRNRSKPASRTKDFTLSKTATGATQLHVRPAPGRKLFPSFLVVTVSYVSFIIVKNGSSFEFVFLKFSKVKWLQMTLWKEWQRSKKVRKLTQDSPNNPQPSWTQEISKGWDALEPQTTFGKFRNGNFSVVRLMLQAKFQRSRFVRPRLCGFFRLCAAGREFGGTWQSDTKRPTVEHETNETKMDPQNIQKKHQKTKNAQFLKNLWRTSCRIWHKPTHCAFASRVTNK